MPRVVLAPRDLLWTGDLQPLAGLHGRHELGGLEEVLGRPCIKLGNAPTKHFHAKPALTQIVVVQIGDLEFAPR